MTIKSINPSNKLLVLRINNERFIRDAQITSDQAGVKFSKNFMSLIPGQHRIEVKYSGDVAPDEFDIKWLQHY